MKRWPAAKTPVVNDGCLERPYVEVLPRVNGAQCKHGKGDCEECGATDRRDATHPTVDGAGVVGQLVKRSKKGKR